jgi:hypothetical protein
MIQIQAGCFSIGGSLREERTLEIWQDGQTGMAKLFDKVIRLAAMDWFGELDAESRKLWQCKGYHSPVLVPDPYGARKQRSLPSLKQ